MPGYLIHKCEQGLLMMSSPQWLKIIFTSTHISKVGQQLQSLGSFCGTKIMNVCPFSLKPMRGHQVLGFELQAGC